MVLRKRKAGPAPEHPFNIPRGPEHVPTVEELVTAGLARPSESTVRGTVTHYWISPEGQALIYDTMKRNSEHVKNELEKEKQWTATQKSLGW